MKSHVILYVCMQNAGYRVNACKVKIMRVNAQIFSSWPFQRDSTAHIRRLCEPVLWSSSAAFANPFTLMTTFYRSTWTHGTGKCSAWITQAQSHGKLGSAPCQ